MSTDNREIAYGPTEGPYKGFRVTDGKVSPEAEEYLKKEKEQSLLAKQTEEGPSPVAMGLLQLGASMMRDSGWRDRPITLGESIGKAIPQGIAGYYNQDIMNKNEEAAVYETQKAEALLAKTASDKKTREDKFARAVANLDDSLFDATGKTSPERIARKRKNLMDRFEIDPKDAWDAIDRLEDKRVDRGTLNLSDEAAVGKKRMAFPGKLENIKENKFLTLTQKEGFLERWGTEEPTTMTKAELTSFGTDYRALIKMTETEEKQASENSAFISGMRDKYATGDPEMEVSSILTAQESGKLDFIENNITNPADQKAELQAFYAEVEKRLLPSNEVRQMTGKELAKLDGIFQGLDPTSLYNAKKNTDGTINIVSKSGLVVKDTPDRAKTYTKSMVDLGIISASQKQVWDVQADNDPGAVIKILQKAMADNLGDTITMSEHEGKVLLGEDIFEVGKDGKQKNVAGLGAKTAYYWDKTKNFWSPVDDKAFSKGTKLAENWNGQAKLYTQSLNAYTGLMAAFKDSVRDPSGAGVSDMTMIRAFLIMLEPNSVVRESEFATAALAQGAQEKYSNLLKQIQSGAILTVQGRRAYLNAARSYMTTVKEQYDKQREQYLKQADIYDIDKGVISNAFEDDKGNSIIEGLVPPDKQSKINDLQFEQLWDNTAVEWPDGVSEPEAVTVEPDPSKITGTMGGGNKK